MALAHLGESVEARDRQMRASGGARHDIGVALAFAVMKALSSAFHMPMSSIVVLGRIRGGGPAFGAAAALAACTRAPATRINHRSRSGLTLEDRQSSGLHPELAARSCAQSPRHVPTARAAAIHG